MTAESTVGDLLSRIKKLLSMQSKVSFFFQLALNFPFCMEKFGSCRECCVNNVYYYVRILIPTIAFACFDCRTW